MLCTCSQQETPSNLSGYLNALPRHKTDLKDESTTGHRAALFDKETQPHPDHAVPLRIVPRASSERLAHMGLKASTSSLEMLHLNIHK